MSLQSQTVGPDQHDVPERQQRCFSFLRPPLATDAIRGPSEAVQYPYISTNNRGFFRCPADRGRGWNFEWTVLNGAGSGISTNDLLFPCSYYHYFQFYMDDVPAGLMVRKLREVRYPTRKAQSACFAASANSAAVVGHGPKGLSLMFVDGHVQFALYKQLNRGTLGDYNLDWTEGGLAGADLR
ncbi:MAG TPA: hypothetical protein VJA21_08180 [Verrucomicrobiae bacterium]